jgi:hypothetical protein
MHLDAREDINLSEDSPPCGDVNLSTASGRSNLVDAQAKTRHCLKQNMMVSYYLYDSFSTFGGRCEVENDVPKELQLAPDAYGRTP